MAGGRPERMTSPEAAQTSSAGVTGPSFVDPSTMPTRQ